ncbi:ankyrin repeat-containing protein [Canna indica]|uniref:Ankyrin repeat-containing protein n=1 Tax=Canna indica TaxID=4628 RepID=A0AAQ3LBJ8_9LILI|nr:ankyrin repeat-containing protein [Canna indica]
MDLRLGSHQVFFSAVRSGDVAAVRHIIDSLDVGDGQRAIAAAAPLTTAQTEAGESTLYIAAENNFEQLLRYLLQLYDFETAAIRSCVDLDSFQVVAKLSHNGI